MIKLSGIGKRRMLKSLFRRFNADYEILLKESDSGENVLKLDITKKSAFLFLSLFVVGSFLLLSLLFLFTPIKYYIPGFETNESRKKILALSARVDSLSLLSGGKDAYLVNLVKVVQDDEDYILDTASLNKDQILGAQINNSGAEDNADKYKHLYRKKRKQKAIDTAQLSANAPPKKTDNAKDKIQKKEVNQVKKKRDTIIIRR